ncbi:MAG: hypothetical protein IT381_06765 [Deltaproteobacteria bacterium]|nr:hypothetical protein [Deltaproteobacteria bacterium]
MPEAPEAPEARGELVLRYEDVAQNGRLLLEAMPTAVGTVTWPRVFKDLGEHAQKQTDMLPILTRLAMQQERGPIGVGKALTGRGTYALAHTRAASGEVDRIFLNMWVELTGIIGNTHGFWVERAGEQECVGRVFAEHVFTRPFAPPAERKVTALNVPAFPAVPPDVYAWRSAEALLADVPADVEWLDLAAAPEPPIVFGLMHTDSNQHVNSLVYPRAFEEAAVRRLAQHGVKNVLADYVELSFRKPCFAGDVVAVSLQVGRVGEAYVARGYFTAAGEAPEKARAFVRMTLLTA